MVTRTHGHRQQVGVGRGGAQEVADEEHAVVTAERKPGTRAAREPCVCLRERLSWPAHGPHRDSACARRARAREHLER